MLPGQALEEAENNARVNGQWQLQDLVRLRAAKTAGIGSSVRKWNRKWLHPRPLDCERVTKHTQAFVTQDPPSPPVSQVPSRMPSRNNSSAKQKQQNAAIVLARPGIVWQGRKNGGCLRPVPRRGSRQGETCQADPGRSGLVCLIVHRVADTARRHSVSLIRCQFRAKQAAQTSLTHFPVSSSLMYRTMHVRNPPHQQAFPSSRRKGPAKGSARIPGSLPKGVSYQHIFGTTTAIEPREGAAELQFDIRAFFFLPLCL